MRQELENLINQKCQIDQEFRKALVSNPKETIARELNILIPDEIKITVVQETTNEKYLVLKEKLSYAQKDVESGKMGLTDVSNANTERVESTLAYAANSSTTGDWTVDRKSIVIPDNWTYEGDEWFITTANPQQESENRWKRSKGVIRNANGQVKEVWVKVEAGPKDTWGAGVSIGVQLNVRMVRR